MWSVTLPYVPLLIYLTACQYQTTCMQLHIYLTLSPFTLSVTHQTQADGPSVRQTESCPHTSNELPLARGGQNQTPGTGNATGPTASRYQPPACCDIPCALIVQHSYEPTNPSELTPKMRMTTFTTSPPTPRLYIQ